MARDTQIVSSADHAAPKDYVIPGNAELVLRAVQATFTDNGASGDWLPCVTLITDSGHTIARACDPNVKVTAGGDAEVSWFPDVTRAPAVATPVGGTSLSACFVDGPPTTLSTWTPNVYTSVTWNLFDTNDATAFAWPGSGGNATVRHLTGGVFSANFTANFQGFNFPVAPGLFIYTVATQGHTREDVEFGINHTTAAWAEGNTNASGHATPLQNSLFNVSAADDITVNAAWTGAGSITFTPRMFVYRIGNQLV